METVPMCYTDKQVSKLLGISAIKLRIDRMNGIGLPYVKIGRCVRYKAADIEAYLENNTVKGVAA